MVGHSLALSYPGGDVHNQLGPKHAATDTVVPPSQVARLQSALVAITVAGPSVRAAPPCRFEASPRPAISPTTRLAWNTHKGSKREGEVDSRALRTAPGLNSRIRIDSEMKDSGAVPKGLLTMRAGEQGARDSEDHLLRAGRRKLSARNPKFRPKSRCHSMARYDQQDGLTCEGSIAFLYTGELKDAP